MKRANSVLVVAVSLLALSCGSEKAASDAAPKSESAITVRGNEVIIAPGSASLQQIQTLVVEDADVPTEEVDAPGKIQADPNRLSHVDLPLAGRITSVLVHLGDTVERGQPVLMLESPDADGAISGAMQAQASVNGAKSGLLKAQADYDRARDLFQNSAVAQKDVLTAESSLAQAKASVDTALAVQEQAGRRLQVLGLQGKAYGQKVEVRAPISGKIMEISVAPNEFRNDTNSSLMTIADLSQVWVSSDVPESKIRFIQRGEQVDVRPLRRASNALRIQWIRRLAPSKCRLSLPTRKGSFVRRCSAGSGTSNRCARCLSFRCPPLWKAAAAMQSIWKPSPAIFRRKPWWWATASAIGSASRAGSRRETAL